MAILKGDRWFQNWNRQDIILLDGAMGTMLQKSGLPLGKFPEVLNVTHPEAVTAIQREYVQSGSDIIYANTFSANRYKLAGSGYEPEEIIKAAVSNAKKAAEGTSVRIGLSAGPIGKLLEPNGELTFEEAYAMYREMFIAGERAGADMISLETMTDLLECKAAVLAARENTSLPVFCTLTFEENGRTFTGVSVEAAAVTLTALGVDALGINCSLGPAEILPLVKEMLNWTPLPVIVKANAGLPNLMTGEYDIKADEFAEAADQFFALGVAITGGCCGTSGEYIKALKQKREIRGGKAAARAAYIPRSVVCSSSQTVVVDGVRAVGERINPTGKKLFQEALRRHDLEYVMRQALDQTEAGAQILDVNVGLPDIDEKATMVEVVKELQGITDVPLQLDTSNPEVMEAALRIYNGKPLLNSVNGEKAVLDRILPLVKKYGAGIIGLTLDENGIPEKAEGRYKIAERIVAAAQEYEIPKEDIYIDCLTLTVSVQQKEAAETLRAVEMVKEGLGVKTVLGVSNVSFGLPNRELINTAFLTLALSRGLDLPIINPNNTAMMNQIYSFQVLYNRDPGAAGYIKRCKWLEEHDLTTPALKKRNIAKPVIEKPLSEKTAEVSELEYAVLNGLKEHTASAARELLKTEKPLSVIDKILIPALDRVGEQFEKGTIFLPQLMQSAAAATAAFDVMKEEMKKSSGEASAAKGTILLATVKGDIHDIGKNIVKVVLENYGFEIIDLGKDVSPELIVKTVKERKVRLVGLSALMTTTVANMEEAIKVLRAETDCRIMVGGAVLTEEYAMRIGADFYAKDAKQSADIARKLFNTEV